MPHHMLLQVTGILVANNCNYKRYIELLIIRLSLVIISPIA